MIIYEVNITIHESIYNSYLKWLKLHIKEMLKNPGFLNSKLYKIKTENIVCVHYFVDNINSLNDYLINNAKVMRKKGNNIFKDKIIINRRVLELEK